MAILAVDDERQIVELIATVLHKNGLDVLTANSAAQALSEFREHSSDVDLLIADIGLPDLDGPSLAARLQAQRPHLKVLLISGFCESGQLAPGFEFLHKPFALDEMLERVFSLLHTKRRRPEPARQAANKGHTHVTAVAER